MHVTDKLNQETVDRMEELLLKINKAGDSTKRNHVVVSLNDRHDVTKNFISIIDGTAFINDEDYEKFQLTVFNDKRHGYELRVCGSGFILTTRNWYDRKATPPEDITQLYIIQYENKTTQKSQETMIIEVFDTIADLAFSYSDDSPGVRPIHLMHFLYSHMIDKVVDPSK